MIPFPIVFPSWAELSALCFLLFILLSLLSDDHY